jgi:hypothetical protein
MCHVLVDSERNRAAQGFIIPARLPIGIPKLGRTRIHEYAGHRNAERHIRRATAIRKIEGGDPICRLRRCWQVDPILLRTNRVRVGAIRKSAHLMIRDAVGRYMAVPFVNFNRNLIR